MTQKFRSGVIHQKLRLELIQHAGYLGMGLLVRCVFMPFLMDPDVCREPAHGARVAWLNLGFAHQDCGTRSPRTKYTRTTVQYHAWTAVQSARWTASPPALMNSLNGLSRRRLR